MKSLVWALGAVLLGLALFEIAMRPTAAERVDLGVIFALLAAVVWLATSTLPKVARRLASLRHTFAVVALTASMIVLIGVVAAGSRMFLSSHDLTLLLVVVAFGILAAVGFAVAVSGPLTGDIAALQEAAGRVAEGDLTPIGGVSRRDEIGELAIAVERMVSRLDIASELRHQHESVRTDFFAAVGHDLRTPLASIKASVDSLRDGLSPDPTKAIATIDQNLGVLTRLVEDLYLLARLESGAIDLAPVWVDVTEIADETVEILSPIAAKRGVTLQLIAQSRVFALASSESVGRVLRNLGDNAIRHSPDSGTVDIEVLGEAGEAVVLVRDEGGGFDPEFTNIAFDRFTRSDPSRGRTTGGSGLGLAIAKSLVETMGGDIWIDSGPGGGVGIKLAGVSTPTPPSPIDLRQRTASHRPA